jgi:hypothetical protein
MKKITIVAAQLFVLASASAAKANTIGATSIDSGTTWGAGLGLHALGFFLVFGTLIAIVAPRFRDFVKEHVMETILAGILVTFYQPLLSFLGFVAPAAGATLH